ncbi:a1d48dd4-2044-4ba3-bdf5-d99bbf99218f-CDS [Sclerotinia trifoliorum]|uniref:A1d48dd4-2044-4ba3-bdf5-d99bbf99218f-CDS n=1 Tax=Sclerotinia trifoliorum TaxID=28548 RepID=A0A8H2ZS61_9HELO|nr:a1d48dd4-2044-4ba3-bdf5-d99bbf99218f-CDS [Sclerotinia trifoliorum]
MSQKSTTRPPHWARPSHNFTTPRLILRSALPSDARPFTIVRNDPQNSPFGGVVDPDLSTEVQAQRLEAQKISTAAGRNAWLVVILKERSEEIPRISDIENLRVDDGFLIGMTGFNSFPVEGSDNGTGKYILVGDIGVLIDYRFARKGYALETLCAVVEYGFYELECGKITLETYSINAPFRGLMKAAKLEDIVVLRRIGDGPPDQEAYYEFDEQKWEDAKKEMVRDEKWPL